jgi:hypothetical protein
LYSTNALPKRYYGQKKANQSGKKRELSVFSWYFSLLYFFANRKSPFLCIIKTRKTNTTMKNILTSALFALSLTAAHAQFGPGGPGGMQGGDGNGRNRSTNTPQQPTLNLESTAPKGNSRITGFVIDSAATQAVEFANIALFSKTTGKPVLTVLWPTKKASLP